MHSFSGAESFGDLVGGPMTIRHTVGSSLVGSFPTAHADRSVPKQSSARTTASFVVSKGCISAQDQARHLLASLEPTLAAAIRTRLQHKFPDHFPLDPYDTSDVYKAALNSLAWQRSVPFVESPREILFALGFTRAGTPTSVPTSTPQHFAPLERTPRTRLI